MSFPRYPAYKSSGVAWLREVPEHWGMGQSRRRFRLRNEPAREEDEQLTASQKYGVIKQADFVESEGRRVVEVIKGQDILKHVEPGDFVISMRSFQGGLEYSRVRGSISSAYVMLAPVKEVIPEFFSWLFKSEPYIQALQSTTNLVRDGQALRFSNFCQVDIPLIPAGEQRAIATFLDRETAKIDALIAEQQRLIELLQEKRQAVISHAVTKGLNPNAPMKDSGVEWLGEVPEHWLVTPIKHVCKIGNGSTPNKENPAYWQEGHFPWLTSTSVNEDQITTANAYITEQALLECSLPVIEPPAILVGITGQGKTRGMAATLRITCTINQHLAFLKPHSDIARIDFLRSAIDNLYAYFRRDTDGAGSTKGAITCSQLGLYKVAVPPPTEQEEIEASIGLAQSIMSELTKDAERNVELLQERRSALISAAVTGQIDVRGLAQEVAA